MSGILWRQDTGHPHAAAIDAVLQYVIAPHPTPLLTRAAASFIYLCSACNGHTGLPGQHSAVSLCLQLSRPGGSLLTGAEGGDEADGISAPAKDEDIAGGGGLVKTLSAVYVSPVVSTLLSRNR